MLYRLFSENWAFIAGLGAFVVGTAAFVLNVLHIRLARRQLGNADLERKKLELEVLLLDLQRSGIR
jgi:hypothetical protein